jgi:hypothetical protein
VLCAVREKLVTSTLFAPLAPLAPLAFAVTVLAQVP